jgi:hypothetical protein
MEQCGTSLLVHVTHRGVDFVSLVPRCWHWEERQSAVDGSQYLFLINDSALLDFLMELAVRIEYNPKLTRNA